MNLPGLAASYLRSRPLQTALSLLLLALGAGTIITLLLVVGQLEGRTGRDARGIDLVVGAKGSPMQLILSGIYQADAPTGNIPLSVVPFLEKNRMVKKAIPLALGDSWKGYRIVGAGKQYADRREGGRPLRRLARHGQRRRAARRGLHGDRCPGAQRFGTRPAGAHQHRERVGGA